jgi:hypothetical protein
VMVTLALQGLGYGAAGTLLPETFPTRYRYTGAGVSYHLASIVGGAVPPLASASLAASFGGVAISLLLGTLSLLSLVCAAALPEAKDRDLWQAQPSPAAIR